MGYQESNEAGERVAIVDLADELQIRKQSIFKVLKRLGIRSTQRREESRKNQNIATVSAKDAVAIRSELLKRRERSDNEVVVPSSNGGVGYSDDVGVFYVVQLEPVHDPGRFKAGFTVEIEGRLQKHRCSAPYAQCLKTWPCRRTWERAAMDCITDKCEQLHTEVFRSPTLELVVRRAEGFFEVMPKLVNQVAQFDEDEKEN